MTDHDYQSAARELGLTVRWLQLHIKELPHQKYLGPDCHARGGRVRFTDRHLDEIRARFEYRPDGAADVSGLKPSTRRRKAS